MTALKRLNPFEFRASVRTRGGVQARAGGQVSIPLNSGHQFEPVVYGVYEYDTRLNPFEFRASVRTLQAELDALKA